MVAQSLIVTLICPLSTEDPIWHLYSNFKAKHWYTWHTVRGSIAAIIQSCFRALLLLTTCCAPQYLVFDVLGALKVGHLADAGITNPSTIPGGRERECVTERGGYQKLPLYDTSHLHVVCLRQSSSQTTFMHTHARTHTHPHTHTHTNTHTHTQTHTHKHTHTHRRKMDINDHC